MYLMENRKPLKIIKNHDFRKCLIGWKMFTIQPKGKDQDAKPESII